MAKRYIHMETQNYMPNGALLSLQAVFAHEECDSLSTSLSLTLLVSMPRDFKFYRAKWSCGRIHREVKVRGKRI